MRENKRYHEAENHTGQDNSHTLKLLKAEMQYWKHSGQENRSTKYLYWMGVRTVRCERL